ncbi:MAG: T9SS type A sorting domain-containing protein [Bacteroidales bacterium]|nr:T9SS type A sorting domain-containing protein [Bacteroidales bacterium]
MDTLHLTINPSTHNPYTVNTCDSYTWNWGDDSITFTLGGNYTRNYLNAYGCYSTDTLYLTIRRSTTADMSVDSCDRYTWNGTTYTQGGSYTYHTTNLAGCDSTINLSLNIRRSTSAVFSATSCDSYTWHGTRYTASNNTATYTSTNAVGCDSVTTLNLTIHYSDLTGSENATACDNYRWHNQTYMESGDYPYSTRTTHNCDSLCTLHLTVHYSGEEEMSATSCEQYVWKGNNYIYSGDYRFDTTTTYGCDSTVILHLTIHYGTHDTEYQNVCETYEWHDSVYTTEGTHIFNYQNEYDCKSADTLHLIVYGARIPQSRSLVLKNLGTDSPQMIIFPREQGEDEYAYEWYRDDAPITGANEQYYRFTEADKGTHVFSVHASPIEQKRCYSVSDTTVKVRLQSTKQLSATPNPNNGVFTLTLTAEDEQALEVSIYNAQGNCVHTLSAEDNNISIRQTLPRGMYMVRVTTDKGNVYTEKIVIN